MAGRVGIVGIGIMGTAMMRNLVKNGFEVVGYDIAEVAMARLVESGGVGAASPRAVFEKKHNPITPPPPSVPFNHQKQATEGGPPGTARGRTQSSGAHIRPSLS